MSNQDFLPRIEPVFDDCDHERSYELYGKIARASLKRVLEGNFSFKAEKDPDFRADQYDHFRALLPIVSMKSCRQAPGELSFLSLSRYRANSFKFFFDMVTGWMLPGKRLNMVVLYGVDFRIPQIGDDVYTLCEVVIRVDQSKDLEQIERNFPILENELRLGIASSYYARRILEVKGVTTDEKVASIQQYIAYLIDRRPDDFDHDVLTEMQHVLVICPEEFKAVRDSRHLSRIISTHYLFRRSLFNSVKQNPEKRHLSLRLLRSHIKKDEGVKMVLSVLVGINFLKDKEIFEKTHILKAVQNYIPSARFVENSFFANRRGSERVCTLYLEIEKPEGEEFTSSEIKMLRQDLPGDLKDRIEHLMHPVFMLRNEEEIMRNMLSLSSQIKYLRDIPQVFITFDEQAPNNLFFTVILVRVLRPDSISIQEMFKSSNTFLEYIHDRCQQVGNLRRKYKKEATVFRVKISKEQFLRNDHTIDLNKARQQVVAELSRVVGEVRDFNGGFISKQNEQLCQLRSLLKNSVKHNELLLENFFYSITPVITRNVIEPEALRTLFRMLLESIHEGFFNGATYATKIVNEPNFVFVMIKTEDRAVKEEISKGLAKLQIHASQLAHSYVSVYDVVYLGYIYRSNEIVQQQNFCQKVQNALVDWELRKRFQSLTN